MRDLPDIGDPIALRDPAGLLYTSRVEGLDDGSIVVVRPADLRAAIEYDVGLDLDVVWTRESGIHVVPGRLSETSLERNIRLWHLEITGAGWTEQRRDYVRVPVTGRIVIVPTAAADADDSLPGQLVDLSEVAAQCAVGVALDDRRVAVGTAVRCRFTLDGEEFDIDGTVNIRRPGSTSRDCRVVIVFDHARTIADALRKQVFRIQIAIRREQQA